MVAMHRLVPSALSPVINSLSYTQGGGLV